MTPLDEETTEAIDALVYRIRDRGEADLEIVIREFMLELRERHGWRPTDARRLPWKVPPGDSPQPDPDKPGGAEYAAVRAELEEHGTSDHPERPGPRQDAYKACAARNPPSGPRRPPPYPLPGDGTQERGLQALPPDPRLRAAELDER